MIAVVTLYSWLVLEPTPTKGRASHVWHWPIYLYFCSDTFFAFILFPSRSNATHNNVRFFRFFFARLKVAINREILKNVGKRGSSQQRRNALSVGERFEPVQQNVNARNIFALLEQGKPSTTDRIPIYPLADYYFDGSNAIDARPSLANSIHFRNGGGDSGDIDSNDLRGFDSANHELAWNVGKADGIEQMHAQRSHKQGRRLSGTNNYLSRQWNQLGDGNRIESGLPQQVLRQQQPQPQQHQDRQQRLLLQEQDEQHPPQSQLQQQQKPALLPVLQAQQQPNQNQQQQDQRNNIFDVDDNILMQSVEMRK